LTAAVLVAEEKKFAEIIVQGRREEAHNGYPYYRQGNGVARVLGHQQSHCW